LAVQEFELRALRLLGRHSMSCTTPPVLFALVILELGPCFLPRWAWTVVLYFTLPAVTGIIVMHHYAQLFSVEMKAHELFFSWVDIEL
jgi:hypothetical protein